MKKRAFFGLGNPGAQYASTRHNIGYRVAEALALHLHCPPFAPARYAEETHISWKGIQWYIFRPTTYMNLSGDAVAYWKEKLDLDYTELIVITDEIQLPLGQMRLTPKGSHGGHNGLAHIIQRLGRTDFPRLRIGIGKSFPKGKQVEYVLSPFSSAEEAVLETLIPEAVACLILWATEGIDRAMNRCNRSIAPAAVKPPDQTSSSSAEPR